MKRSYLDTGVPIAALATVPGESALAVIRTAGPGAVELAAPLFSRPAALLSARGLSLVHGELVDPKNGEAVDEVLAGVFRAPAGPIGEDGVEFYCHGSPAVIRRALSLLEEAGFAPALPGEFSFRAFLRGKTDLVKVEAVQELVRAGNEGARAEAFRRLEGGLSRALAASREAIVDALTEAEARLDYAEDDDSPAGGLDPAVLRRVRDLVAGLAASYAAGRLYERGARAVVVGRPNAGKSSLFNLLIREERSIVASDPGTTRDWIESGIELGGLPVRLIDTAGLRDTSRDASGEVEAAGVSRSRRLADEAEAVIYVVDGVLGIASEDRAFLESRPDSLRVWNKADDPRCEPTPLGFLRLSAATGEGLPALADALRALIAPRFGCSGTGRPRAEAEPSPGATNAVTVASERQKLLLDRAVSALDAALSGLEAGMPLDALVLDLRDAADALGEITGEIASEEILEAIFSRFCLGK
ncbi:MAG: tRNA modification GTPase [Rectinemataceae bacterium]|jgi:tRNA modification GTPase